MPEHTPGPWRVVDRGSGNVYSAAIDIAAGNYRVVGGPVDGDPEQIRADARLIAAAPDLLEAVVGMLASVHKDDPACDAARAALIKATEGIDDA
jgi:hypothetical protein